MQCWKCKIFVTERQNTDDKTNQNSCSRSPDRKRRKQSNNPCTNISTFSLPPPVVAPPVECCICGQDYKHIRGLFPLRHLCLSKHPNSTAICDSCFAPYIFSLGRVDTSKACGCPEALLEVLEMNDSVSLSPVPTCPLCRSLNFGHGVVRISSLTTMCRTKSPNSIVLYLLRFKNLPPYALPVHFHACLDLLHVYAVRGHRNCNAFLRSVISLHGNLETVLLAAMLFSWGRCNKKANEITIKCHFLCRHMSLPPPTTPGLQSIVI